MRTNFEFFFNGRELFGEDGQNLTPIFDSAVDEARIMVKHNPSLLFELRRRLIERAELNDMEAMARGSLYTAEGLPADTIVVVSDFPAELMDASEDEGGYNVSRQQTMLRVIKLINGKINITTQSLDGSNRQALEDIYAKLGKKASPGELLEQRIYLAVGDDPRFNLVDELTDTYDDSLNRQKGGKWHAGILQTNQLQVDTYDFACAQHDLIDWFVAEKFIDPIGAERHRYKLAATAKTRYERYVNKLSVDYVLHPEYVTPEMLISPAAIAGGQNLLQELDRESRRASARGETFSGCGSTVKLEQDGSLTEDQIGLAGYGNKTDSDQYGSLKFKCPRGHTNTREKNKLLDKCKTCGTSVKC
jgi:hypothetical protein